MSKYLYIILLFFLLIPLIGKTQAPSNKKFQLEYLNNQICSDFLFDQSGFLWANSKMASATLYRYDGYKMLGFSHQAASPYRLDIPAEFAHSFLAILANGQIVSVSAPTQSLMIFDPISFEHQHFSLASLGIMGEIKAVAEHPQGGIGLLSSESQGTHVYHWKANELKTSFRASSEGSFLYASLICEPHQVWVTTFPGNTYRFDWQGKLLHFYSIQDFPFEKKLSGQPPQIYFETITQVRDKSIYASLRHLRPSLYRYNAANEQFEVVPEIVDKDYVVAPIEDQQGNLLFPYGNFNREHWAVLKTKEEEWMDYSASQNLIESPNLIAEDFTKAMYARNAEGLLKIEFPNQKVKKVQFDDYIFKGIYEVHPDTFLVGNEDFNWLMYHPKTNDLRGIKLKNNTYPFYQASFCRGFARDKSGKYWSNDELALHRFDLYTGKRDSFPCPAPIDQSWLQLASGDICVALADTSIRIFNKKTWDFDILNLDPSFHFGIVHAILEDTTQQQLWLGTDEGLILYDQQSKNSFRYTIKDGLSSNDIQYLYRATNADIWLGTTQGVSVFNPSSQTTDIIGEKEGIAHPNVVGIFEHKEKFWFSTFNGISIYNPTTRSCRNLSVEDGFNHKQFNNHALCKTSDGAIILGAINGINYFYPDDFEWEAAPQLLITAIDCFDNQKDTIVRKIPTTKAFSIELPAFNKYLHLELTLSDFENRQYHRYQYRIKGLNRDWIDIGHQNEITISSLPKGDYTLEIKGATQHSHWSDVYSIPLVVEAFFYETLWFYALCSFLLGGAIFWWIRRLASEKIRLETEVQRRTQQIEEDKNIIEQQAKELQSLDRLKSRFFANITHEFRTPLTIIQGFTKETKERTNSKSLRSNLQIIQQNSEQLLHLVNQILDLSKLEFGELKAHYQQANVIPLLKYAHACFMPLAKRKNIQLIWKGNEEGIIMDFDKDKLLKIVFNLLSNAVKFTPKDGQVIMEVSTINESNTSPSKSSSSLFIKVKDTGIGIKAEEVYEIFNRFYQVDNTSTRKQEGTGLGLAYTKELVKLLNGTIEVESQIDKGTCFVIQLPIRREALIKNQADQTLDAPMPTSLTTADSQVAATDTLILQEEQKPLVLIVEDNPQIFAYLKLCLKEGYQLVHSENGALGIQKAIELIPDLIISDVMMPEKDGFEVCDTLKRDERTSHIPIILLTALTSVEYRISGLKKGADAYLGKPFDKEELLAQLETLLKLRQKLQEYYQQNQLLDHSTIPVEKNLKDWIHTENDFLLKLQSIIDREIGNVDLNADIISKKLFMSRSQFYRKLKALTNQSVAIYVRTYRLYKAKQLLLENDQPIYQIAYATGFKKAKYFSRLFSQEFGQNPSDFRKKQFPISNNK